MCNWTEAQITFWNLIILLLHDTDRWSSWATLKRGRYTCSSCTFCTRLWGRWAPKTLIIAKFQMQVGKFFGQFRTCWLLCTLSKVFQWRWMKQFCACEIINNNRIYDNNRIHYMYIATKCIHHCGLLTWLLSIYCSQFLRMPWNLHANSWSRFLSTRWHCLDDSGRAENTTGSCTCWTTAQTMVFTSNNYPRTRWKIFIRSIVLIFTRVFLLWNNSRMSKFELPVSYLSDP